MKRINRKTTSEAHLLVTIFDLIDAVVELYLGRVIRPFVKVHEKFYSGLNVVLRSALDNNPVPSWFTANFITYFRTALVVPTLLLVANRHCVAAAAICIAVDFGDFLDGVVARYWVDEKKKLQQASEKEQADDKDKLLRSGSPATSDEDSFGTYLKHPSYLRPLCGIRGESAGSYFDGAGES